MAKNKGSARARNIRNIIPIFVKFFSDGTHNLYLAQYVSIPVSGSHEICERIPDNRRAEHNVWRCGGRRCIAGVISLDMMFDSDDDDENGAL